jgi:hypothetical protein
MKKVITFLSLVAAAMMLGSTKADAQVLQKRETMSSLLTFPATWSS